MSETRIPDTPGDERTQFCPTCNGNGSEQSRFDANCPAAWAHQYLRPLGWLEGSPNWASSIRKELADRGYERINDPRASLPSDPRKCDCDYAGQAGSHYPGCPALAWEPSPALSALRARIRELTESAAPLLPEPSTEHPEAFCQRCQRPNVLSWHAPSPLWNAVMRSRTTGIDAYSVVCPPCFAEVAQVFVGAAVWCFKPHDFDVSPLWEDADGRQWSVEKCLWESPSGLPEPSSTTAELETLLNDYRSALQDMEHLSESVGAEDFRAFSKARDDSRMAVERYVGKLVASDRRLRKMLAQLVDEKYQRTAASPPSSTTELTELLDQYVNALAWHHGDKVSTGECEDCRKPRAAIEALLGERDKEIERLRRFETYVCQVIAMGNQADLTVEGLPK